MNSAFKSSRKLNKRGSKASNAGFSLVELLIAVVILAIIVIPLLRMFVTSTKINVKSRQMLRATTVAQDIMEGLKAYTLEEVKTQFTPPTGTSGGSYFIPTEGFYVLNASMIQAGGGVREITELEKENPNDPDHEIYYFGIKNLKMQGGEYDALIKLDASTYTEDKAGQADSLHDNAFNGAFYADINSVSETSGGSDTDSSYHEHKELNDAVLADVKEQIKDAIGEDALPSDWADKTLEDFVTKREILVTIEDAHEVDADGNGKCKATITFTYTCTYNGMTYTSNGKAGTAADRVDGITRIFSSGNFYLFYYPIYKAGFQDIITFDIDNASKLTDPNAPMLRSITLAKQIRSDVLAAEGVIVPELTDAKLNEGEIGYRATVGITSDTALKSELNFKTNVRTNLSNQAKTTDPDTGKVEWGTLNQSMVHIGYGGGVTMQDVNVIDMIGDIVSDKVTNVIYDIEISVYETGAAEHFGDADFENTREQSRLARITNLD